jgi:NitT/TauT family transport system substrate-binding protein
MDHTFFSIPAIKNPADLKKKRIGISRPGSADDYGVRILLRKWNLDPDKEVALLTIGGQPTRLSAMQAGRIDASVFQLPTTAQARKAGLSELAFLGDLGIDYLGTSIVATNSMIQKNPVLVERFVKSFVEGIAYLKTNKEASLKSIARFTKLEDRAVLEEAYNTYAHKLLPQVPYPSNKGIEAILEDLGKKNPKARAADPAKFIETRFLKELEASGFIAQLYRK